MASFLNVLAHAAFPAAAVVVGGIAASICTPGPTTRSAVQHVAAGVVDDALATELLPDVMHRQMPLVTIVGFALGVVATRYRGAAARSARSTVSLGDVLCWLPRFTGDRNAHLRIVASEPRNALP